MCGRYTLSDPGDILTELEVDAELLEAGLDERLPDWAPRYNIAPTQNAPVVRTTRGGPREVAWMRWGLVPSWAKDASIGNRMINARAETAADKPSFRVPLRRKRCAVLADGFYEWKKTSGGKQPYHIHLRELRPFVMAGLWDRWTKGSGDPLESFTILTTSPNPKVAELHDRMPVILRREAWDLWLDPSIEDADVLTEVLGAYPEEGMDFYPVSKMVNSPANDQPACLAPRPLEPRPLEP